MGEERFTMLYDELLQFEDITPWDVIVLSLVISFCHYAESNEIYLKTKTLMQRFKRSESQVKRMIKRLEDKKYIEVYSKGYGHYKMRYIQVVDARLQRLIGDAKIAPSVASQVEAKMTYYEELNSLFLKARISKEEVKSVTNIPYARVLYYHVLFRSLRETRGISVNVEPAVLGYLKVSIDDGELMKLGDIKRIVTAVGNAEVEGLTDGKSIMHRVIWSINATNENYVSEGFSYERLERELGSAKVNDTDQNAKIIPFESRMEEQWRKAQEPQSMVN